MEPPSQLDDCLQDNRQDNGRGQLAHGIPEWPSILQRSVGGHDVKVREPHGQVPPDRAGM